MYLLQQTPTTWQTESPLFKLATIVLVISGISVIDGASIWALKQLSIWAPENQAK